MRTEFTGHRQCLDIVNDGTNDQLQMATCGNYSGQSWTAVPLTDGVHYRLITPFTGPEKCLDIVNDGKNNNHPVMAACGNFSGQSWALDKNAGHNAIRLRNDFSGDNKCLDIINDGLNNRLIMADCADVSGQYWRRSRS